MGGRAVWVGGGRERGKNEQKLQHTSNNFLRQSFSMYIHTQSPLTSLFLISHCSLTLDL